MTLRHLAAASLLLLGGCSAFPEVAHEPTFHNPFPQLSKVAIVPFFNMSDEATLSGRRVADAYFSELQDVAGFEVVPVSSVDAAIRANRIQLNDPGELRRLAHILGVDAVVVGAITDYSPYYPPRMAMHVRWYAANPCFHPIPPGYGLPWGTPAEEEIPAPIVFEAEMALAKAQMETQTPRYELADAGIKPQAAPVDRPPELQSVPDDAGGDGRPADSSPSPDGAAPGDGPDPRGQVDPRTGQPIEKLSHETVIEGPGAMGVAGMMRADAGGLPPDWPDPRGFVPPPPKAERPQGQINHEPVLQHTQIFIGTDPELTEALETYFFFRDDTRMGGWQSYLQRSEDFIRFCCHMHIAEMLSARGGAGQTRVVWRWPVIR